MTSLRQGVKSGRKSSIGSGCDASAAAGCYRPACWAGDLLPPGLRFGDAGIDTGPAGHQDRQSQSACAPQMLEALFGTATPALGVHVCPAIDRHSEVPVSNDDLWRTRHAQVPGTEVRAAAKVSIGFTLMAKQRRFSSVRSVAAPTGMHGSRRLHAMRANLAAPQHMLPRDGPSRCWRTSSAPPQHSAKSRDFLTFQCGQSVSP